MVHYSELGLVNTNDLFKKPLKENMQFPHSTSTTWNSCRLLFLPVWKQILL